MNEIELLQAILDALLVIKWHLVIGFGVLIGISVAKR